MIWSIQNYTAELVDYVSFFTPTDPSDFPILHLSGVHDYTLLGDSGLLIYKKFSAEVMKTREVSQADYQLYDITYDKAASVFILNLRTGITTELVSDKEVTYSVQAEGGVVKKVIVEYDANTSPSLWNTMTVGDVPNRSWQTLEADTPPLPIVYVNNVTVREGDTANLYLSLSGAFDYPISINFSLSSRTALIGEVENGGDVPAIAGTVTFAPGEYQKLIQVEVPSDDLVEPTEHFAVVLTPSHPDTQIVRWSVAESRVASEIEVTIEPSALLFDMSDNLVDFTALTDAQLSAIALGAQRQNALDGSDVVQLESSGPSVGLWFDGGPGNDTIKGVTRTTELPEVRTTTLSTAEVGPT